MDVAMMTSFLMVIESSRRGIDSSLVGGRRDRSRFGVGRTKELGQAVTLSLLSPAFSCERSREGGVWALVRGPLYR